METTKRWQRAELLIFTIITILNMLPFVATRFFPSMDGASHLSNSNIISQLVFHNNDLFHKFFMINPEPVPNWTSHLLVSIFTLIMPAFLAEKILIIIILTGTPFAFRILMQTVSPKNTLYSLLIFPFTHSMFFFFGFFNFCMAILLFLVTLNYWLRHEPRALNLKQTGLLALLVALTYFSHIVIFGILLIVIAVHIISGAIAAMLCKTNDLKFILRQFLVRTLTITLSALVPLFLFAYFFYSRPETREIKFIGRHELINILSSIRPLISLNPVIEGKLLTVLFFLFVFLAVAGFSAFIARVYRKLSKNNSPEPEKAEPLLPRFNFWWLLSSVVILLALFFTLPDAYGTASYTSYRIGYVFFLLAILWISTFRIPWYFGMVALVISLYVNTMLIRYYTPSLRDMGKLASACNKAADFVAPNSIVLPIYCMDNWFTGHFVDYMAVDKPIVMVYNYECESGYFPVKWNMKLKPNYYMGNPATPEKFINFDLIKGNPSLRLDYVFVLGHYDPQKDWFFSTLDKILSENFVRVYKTESCCLYRNNLARVN
ncbi:MAG: hypothetical protein NT040_16470 [Bacteroidetes bacterium]|nr:hypothetical protein [Bacteroidota bacterium]